MAINQVVLAALPNTVSFDELSRVAAAVQRQLTLHLFKGWKFNATIHAVHDLRESPAGAGQILVVNSITAAPGTFGFHLVNPNNVNNPNDDQPFALVEHSPSGLWTIDVSHECVEMLINPFGNTMLRAPSLEGDRLVDYLLEVCDPCGRAGAYDLDTGVLLADFVTHAYYGPSGTNGPFTVNEQLAGPRLVQPGGYLAWAEMSNTGELGSGPWRRYIAGGVVQAIPRPNIFASLRQGIDFDSHGFVAAHEKACEEGLRRRLREIRRLERARQRAQARSARRLERFVQAVGEHAKQKKGVAPLLKRVQPRRPRAEQFRPPSG